MEKDRELRARRAAERQGLRVERCRRRDPRSLGYGTYRLVDVRTRTVIAGDPDWFGLTLDDIERRLDTVAS